MTTPLEREILTHYYVSPEPFRLELQGPISEIIDYFVDLGLLKWETQVNRHRKIVGNQEALKVYMDALANVPLPVQRWVIPEI